MFIKLRSFFSCILLLNTLPAFALSTECDTLYGGSFQPITGEHTGTASNNTPQPQKSAHYLDATYGACVVRATDHANEPPVDFARSEYSRKQAFNIDNTRIAILSNNGFWHLYDADNHNYILQLNGPASDSELRWHPTDPDILYYMSLFGGTQIFELNIISNTSTVVADFGNELQAIWPTAARAWTKAEGSSSADGRYWGLQVETTNFDGLGLMVWDMQLGQIVGTWDFAANGVGRPDHTSMSPSGDYIVASWDGNAFGTTAFTRDFSTSLKVHHKSEHSDLALLPNGNDAYIAIDYQSNGGDVFYIDIQAAIAAGKTVVADGDPERVVLFPTYVNGDATALHFSGKAFDKPGWVLVSTYANNGSPTWYKDKIFAIDLTPNPTIVNLAHHFSQGGGYWAEPHASVNKDFTKVAFNSNWLTGSDTDVDNYIIELPADLLDNLPPGNTNQPPTISGSPAATIVLGNAYVFTPTASDPNGDTLSFSISNAPAWGQFDTTTGTLSGTPSSADIGTHSNIIISVSDGEFTISLPSFSITVSDAPPNNLPPEISGTPDSSITVNNTYTFTPTASDPNGDLLNFSISNMPAWAQFDSTTGNLSGTVSSADIGVYSNIIISVSDGEFTTSLPGFSITVSDTPPPPTGDVDEFTATDGTNLSSYGYTVHGDNSAMIINNNQVTSTVGNTTQVALSPNAITETDFQVQGLMASRVTNYGYVYDSLALYITDGDWAGYGVRYSNDYTNGFWHITQYDNQYANSDVATITVDASTDLSQARTVTLVKTGDTLAVLVDGNDVGLSHTITGGTPTFNAYGIRTQYIGAFDEITLDDLTLITTN